MFKNSRLGSSLPSVLINFSNWLGHGDLKHTRVWGNDPSFDITILENAYRACNISIPWQYYNIGCVRTIASLAAVKKCVKYIDRNRPTLEHDALSDAIAQCKDVQNYYKILGLNNVPR